VVEGTTVTSRRPSPLFLLSTFPSPSRCQSGNVAALSSQGHFFVGAVCLFRRGICERPSTLDRQLRTPTKDRIRNTPKRKLGTVRSFATAPSKNLEGQPCTLRAGTQVSARAASLLPKAQNRPAATAGLTVS
jgi:hypothetical protein